MIGGRSARIVAISLLTAALTGQTLPPSAAAPASAAAVPGVMGTDDRRMWDSDAWPWHAIGRINREAGGFCTGTLVAPALVLTAAHCLFDRRTGRRVAPETVHFVAGYRRGRWLSHRLARGYVDPVAGREAGRSTPAAASDWVLIVLERAMDLRPVPVVAAGAGGVEGDGAIARAGYGRDRPHLLSLHDGCTLGEPPADANILFHTCDATHGDSGSPLLTRTEDGWALVGIATGVTRTADGPKGLGVPARAFARAIDREASRSGPASRR